MGERQGEVFYLVRLSELVSFRTPRRDYYLSWLTIYGVRDKNIFGFVVGVSMFCLLVKFDLLQEFVFVPCGLFFQLYTLYCLREVKRKLTLWTVRMCRKNSVLQVYSFSTKMLRKKSQFRQINLVCVHTFECALLDVSCIMQKRE